MTEKIPAILSWSGGKDCAYALQRIRQEGRYEVQYLVSVFQQQKQVLNMHRVPVALLEMQAAAIGIPLVKVFVTESGNSHYEEQLSKAILPLKAGGVHHIIFGDIFLQDLRAYREHTMQNLGMHCVFPLWQMNTTTLLRNFIAEGFKAIVCCVDAARLSRQMAGSLVDQYFEKLLPVGVDKCGENGEYHSFCFDGPYFASPVRVDKGSVYFESLPFHAAAGVQAGNYQKGFWYCELFPAIETGEHKTCPRCKKSFTCNAGHIQACFCSSLYISANTLTSIREQYHDCLCEECLLQVENA